MAAALKVSQPTVWHWINAGRKQVPAEYCHDIEALTKGEITKEQLRPDIFRPTPNRGGKNGKR